MATMDWQQQSSAPVYPEGTYKVMVTKWERCESLKKKTPQLKWNAEIIEPVEHRGRPITDFQALTDAAMWKVHKFVQACGIDTSKLDKMDSNSPAFEAILNCCVNRKIILRLQEVTSDEGKIFNNVTDYLLDTDQEIIEPVLGDDIAWEE